VISFKDPDVFSQKNSKLFFKKEILTKIVKTKTKFVAIPQSGKVAERKV
jgi:hypothetical protein